MVVSRRLSAFLAVAGIALALAASGAMAAVPATKAVAFRGYRIVVPASWPVYHVSPGSTTCVRFDRHAVYLGTPSAAQRCPAHAAGRTEAILVTPLSAGAQPVGGSQAQLTVVAHGLAVTATWGREPGLVRRALGVKLPRTPASTATVTTALRSAARRNAVPNAATGTVFTGQGFDACSTPSLAQMTAWGASPYRALGVYIGGANMACSQPNLNTAWVQTQWAAGWHLIPTYVGLQAPSNSCGCASIVPGQASAEGTAAAIDAVAQAQAVGIGAGNPIYDDMEGYSRTTANTSAVMAFLAAWTTQLHAQGYGSGVYSSAGSGMQDLAARYGTTYTEPDDIWLADWNGSQSTDDPYVPSADWAARQRLHQYAGAHNETYGRVTINIDGDYLDGATAFGAGAPPAVAPAPSLRVLPRANGTISLYASWPGAAGIAAWRALGGSSPTALGTIDQSAGAGAATTIAEHNAYPYYAVQAIDSGGLVLGTSATIATAPHLALYGRSAFVPSRGLVGVPAGCFTGSQCRATLQMFVAQRRIAHSGPEWLGASGILYIKLSAADRALLAHAAGRRLPVTLKATDVSGVSASANMSLVPFVTTGSGPPLSSARNGTLALLGLRDFVYRRAVGGILASCSGAAACLVTTTITAGNATVATTGLEFIGANEAAYLSFKLSPYGRSLLARAPGNQLGARVRITGATAGTTVSGSIALSGFG